MTLTTAPAALLATPLATPAKLALATAHLDCGEWPEARVVMLELLTELDHSDGVLELLRHTCARFSRALPVPLPELLDAVLAAGSRDCTFVFRHCAWSAPGAANAAIETLCASSCMRPARVAYLQALTSHMGDVPSCAASWVQRAVAQYAEAALEAAAPAGANKTACDLLDMTLDFMTPDDVPLAHVLALGVLAPRQAMVVLQEYPTEALQPHLSALCALAKADLSHRASLELVSRLCRVSAAPPSSGGALAAALVAASACALEEVECVLALCEAGVPAPADLPSYVAEALRHYAGPALTALGRLGACAAIALGRLHNALLPSTATDLVMLCAAAPGPAWLALAGMPLAVLRPLLSPLVSCLSKFVRSWGCAMPSQGAVLGSLSGAYPVEVARAVAMHPGAGMETLVGVESLWLLPTGVLQQADGGELGPAQRLFAADPARAVQMGLFTELCVLSTWQPAHVLRGGLRPTLPLVDAHSLAYDMVMREAPVEGRALALFAELDATRPQVADAMRDKTPALGAHVEAARRWLRRRTWLLVVSRAARRPRNPACKPCARGVRRLGSDVVRAVASWL